MSSNYRGRGGGYPPSDDYYSREDPYSRAPQREDPYEQDPYGRTQTADPYSREDPYGRTKPPSDVRYRSDPYLRDDSADELDTRGPSDYRERPDRPRNKSYAPTSRPGKSVVAPSPNVLYELEHLATFTVSPKQGLVRPADGVKRLRDMEATSGVWALRVQLRLDRREIIIIEKANQKELECFQISRVSNPTFIMSSSSDDLYNNIVLFTVQSEAGPRMPSEMHLFQCIGNSGQDVADDIEAAISGKFPRTPAIKETRRPRSMSPRSWDDNLSALSGFEDLVRPEVPPVRQEFYNPPPKINKVPVPPPQPKNNDDVTMLNHCFDDIESFVASLQQAANAQKELERRRMMNGSRDPAEETLRARAQPPPLADFVSTLQKFKLAFNLLPKLQLLLKDPDATQLLSMLFGPLSLVVNASRDERGVPTIAQKVDSPLLTAEACRMMLTCLNQNESDLLKSLGPAWITPSDRWMGTPPPQYIPRFNDGWQHPGFSMTDVGASLPSNQPYNAPFQQNGNYPGPSSYGQTTESYGNPYGQPEVSWQSNNYPQQVTGQGPSQGFQQAPPQGPPMQPQGYPQGQIPGMVPQPQGIPQGQAPGMPPQSQPQPQALPPPKPNPSQQRYLDDLRSRGARICIAAAAREGKNAKELNVNTGDVVEVLDSSKNWWKVKNHTDQSGFVPNTLLTPYSQ